MAVKETDHSKRDPAAVALGKAGGKARARKLSPERRQAIAQAAAIARWTIKEAKTPVPVDGVIMASNGGRRLPRPKAIPAMTPSERKKWWTLHGATNNGTAEDEFAKDLEARGIIKSYDGMANVTYWIFTELGGRVYFGDDSSDG